MRFSGPAAIFAQKIARGENAWIHTEQMYFNVAYSVSHTAFLTTWLAKLKWLRSNFQAFEAFRGVFARQGTIQLFQWLNYSCQKRLAITIQNRNVRTFMLLDAIAKNETPTLTTATDWCPPPFENISTANNALHLAKPNRSMVSTATEFSSQLDYDFGFFWVARTDRIPETTNRWTNAALLWKIISNASTFWSTRTRTDLFSIIKDKPEKSRLASASSSICVVWCGVLTNVWALQQPLHHELLYITDIKTTWLALNQNAVPQPHTSTWLDSSFISIKHFANSG